MDSFIKEGYSNAIREWEKALQLDPENDEVKKRIKDARIQLKRKQSR
ncbi:MAG: tetratricopeptide repeat protein [Spirochaetes bacterium]|nr:tetratricopeptide repeat protein [Spirochaetota bacterium]